MKRSPGPGVSRGSELECVGSNRSGVWMVIGRSTRSPMMIKPNNECAFIGSVGHQDRFGDGGERILGRAIKGSGRTTTCEWLLMVHLVWTKSDILRSEGEEGRVICRNCVKGPRGAICADPTPVFGDRRSAIGSGNRGVDCGADHGLLLPLPEVMLKRVRIVAGCEDRAGAAKVPLGLPDPQAFRATWTTFRR
jgi:hypothetical protein